MTVLTAAQRDLRDGIETDFVLHRGSLPDLLRAADADPADKAAVAAVWGGAAAAAEYRTGSERAS